MTSLSNRNNIKETVLSVLKKYPVKHAGIIGSYARGDQTEDSDLDLFVEFRRGTTLFDIVRIKDEIHDLLNISVDIISKNAKIRDIVLKSMLKDLIPIL
ncbi:nucleotidyltransferase family protein [bacterium]|nr:nucleotidyltransferase family protein [bacterium]